MTWSKACHACSVCPTEALTYLQRSWVKKEPVLYITVTILLPTENSTLQVTASLQGTNRLAQLCSLQQQPSSESGESLLVIPPDSFISTQSSIKDKDKALVLVLSIVQIHISSLSHSYTSGYFKWGHIESWNCLSGGRPLRSSQDINLTLPSPSPNQVPRNNFYIWCV